MGIMESSVKEVLSELDPEGQTIFGYVKTEGKKRQKIQDKQRYEKEKKEGMLLERKGN